jgi:release factor glutamine methyltransferase
MATVGELLVSATTRLRESGSETARLDAEVLLASVTGEDRTTLIAHHERPIGEDVVARFEQAVARRSGGEPVAYIRGIKEFFGLAFAVDRRALIPRPESELLVEAGRMEVMARLTDPARTAADRGPVRIADVGTGSGAIAIALAVELRRRRVVLGNDVRIIATDSSADALELARANAVAHAVADAVRFYEANLLPPVLPDEAPLDIILANLPYVIRSVIPTLPVATSFEPVAALDGGPDGLDAIRALLERLPDALTGDGIALLEIGADQAERASAAARERLARWRIGVEPDIAGLPRLLRLNPPGAGA